MGNQQVRPVTRPHPTYSNYSAAEDGIILGVYGKPLKPIQHHTGYMALTVRHNGKSQRQYRWHRFVYECWNGLIETEDLVINHIDGVKTNNQLSNLELVSHRVNVEHAFQLNLRNTLKGEDVGGSKLTEESCTELILDLRSGMRNPEAGLKYGLHPGYVSLIRHRRRWKHLWEKLELANFNDHRKGSQSEELSRVEPSGEQQRDSSAAEDS